MLPKSFRCLETLPALHTTLITTSSGVPSALSALMARNADIAKTLELVAHQAQHRRRSKPADEAVTQADQVNDPNHVANSEQLQSLVKRDPATFFAYLDELREQRDVFLEVAEWYKEGVIRNQRTQKSFDEAAVTMEGLQEEIDRLTKRNTNLSIRQSRNSLVELRGTTASFAGKNSQNDDDEEDFKVDSGPQSAVKKDKSSKVPDPPVFLGTNEPEWDDWLSQMDNKLLVNGDWYPTSDAAVTYVLSRLGGKAMKHTMNRRLRGCPNPYTNYIEILDELADIYEDSDRKNNMGRQYEALHMLNSQKFIDFYAEFIRLGTALGTDEETLLRHLYNKIRPGLQESWDTIGDFPTIKAAKEYLRRLDNVQRARYAEKRTVRQATGTKSGAQVRPSRVVPLPVTPTIPVNKTDPITKELTCYKCGATGHLRRDCPLSEPNAAGKKAFQEAKIHAMTADDEDMIDQDNLDEIDDSSDSGKE